MTAVCISKLGSIHFITSCWTCRPHRWLRWKKNCLYNLVKSCIPVCFLHRFSQVPIKKQFKTLHNLIHKICTIFGPQTIEKSFPSSNTIVHVFPIQISLPFSSAQCQFHQCNVTYCNVINTTHITVTMIKSFFHFWITIKLASTFFEKVTNFTTTKTC